MAKRRARTPARRQAPAALTRKQRSRLEREKRLERYLVAGVVVVAVAVVGVLAYGLINEFVIKAASPVATVGATTIRTDEFQSRVRFLRANMAMQLRQWEEQRRAIDPSDDTADFLLNYIDQNIRQLEATLAEENERLIGFQALDQLVRHELVRQEAIRRGIAATSDEVQRRIELEFNYDRTAITLPLSQTEVVSLAAESELLPTPVSEEAFAEQYDFFIRDVLKPLGISERQYRSWSEAELLEQRLRAQMAAGLPDEADQIAFRLLVLDDLDRASELVARLDAGEEFQILVDEIEADEGTTDYVRDFDWLPRDQVEGTLWPDVAAELWQLPVSGYAGPIVSLDGLLYYVAEVAGHEMRELDGSLLETLADAAFEEWMAELKDSTVEIGPYEDRIPSDP